MHHQYKEPWAWKPERFMPGGEYDQFDEEIRPYMVGARGAAAGRGCFFVLPILQKLLSFGICHLKGNSKDCGW